jgi:hypothetical protein
MVQKGELLPLLLFLIRTASKSKREVTERSKDPYSCTRGYCTIKRWKIYMQLPDISKRALLHFLVHSKRLLNQTFLMERSTNDKCIHEKMSNNLSHKENTNQTYIVIPSQNC